MMSLIGVQGLPFLACLAMLSILCYIGIHVLKREVIFIDIALAQIAAVGAIVAHVVFHIHGHNVYSHALALGSTLIAAAFFAVVRRRIAEIPLEAVIGVSYAVAAASALFLVGVSPGGHVHVQEMLAGSILWAAWSDVAWSAGVFAIVGVCFYIFRKPFGAISEGYEDALARGYNTLGWDFLLYALIGLVITTAVRIAGVVVVFTFLIIPATLSAVFAVGWPARLAVAWTAGALSSALGLLFAARYDFSVGPAIALFLGSTLVVVGLFRLARLGRTQAGVGWLVIAFALGGWLAAGAEGPAGIGAAPGGDAAGASGGIPTADTMTHTHDHEAHHGHGGAHGHEGDADDPSMEINTERLETVNDMAVLEDLYAAASDAEERSLVVSRALEVDARSGARMALKFLEDDPPMLFGLMVVEKLEEIAGRDMGYDIDKPYDSPSNRESIAEMKKALGLD
jgi:zinc/manganese transport system permease protein